MCCCTQLLELAGNGKFRRHDAKVLIKPQHKHRGASLRCCLQSTRPGFANGLRYFSELQVATAESPAIHAVGTLEKRTDTVHGSLMLLREVSNWKSMALDSWLDSVDQGRHQSSIDCLQCASCQARAYSTSALSDVHLSGTCLHFIATLHGFEHGHFQVSSALVGTLRQFAAGEHSHFVGS